MSIEVSELGAAPCGPHLFGGVSEFLGQRPMTWCGQRVADDRRN